MIDQRRGNKATNLYFEYPQIVQELKGKLDEYKRSGRSAPLRK